MSSSKVLKQIFAAGRPMVEQALDVAEQIAALRETATNQGLDWSQVKALLKAQIQDERDERGDGRRVQRLLEKAEFASSYADMLGLGNMNENNFSAATPAIPAHDAETGEIIEPPSASPAAEQAGAELPNVPPTLAAPAVFSQPDPDITLPDFLNRAKRRELEAAE